MKMQIVSCPRCGTFLFQDTTECHSCGHVIEQKPTVKLKTRALPTDSAVENDMEICSNCGESCRSGLVRCWNCSAFLRPEIEESYKRMLQSGRHKAQHVELEILEATSVTEEDSFKRRSSTPENFLTSQSYDDGSDFGDDDFELSEGAELGEIDEEGYDLMPESQHALLQNGKLDLSNLESFEAGSAPSQESEEGIPIAQLSPVAEEQAEAPPVATEVESPSVATEIEAPAAAASAEPPVRPNASEPPVRAGAGEEPPTIETRLADDLMKIAVDEEQDIQRVRKDQRSKDTFLIYCPQGCRIRVKEKHRGKTGKCPRCQSEFVVPRKVIPKRPEEVKPEPVLESRYQKWLPEIRLHTVDPLKLRIKIDSLLNECQAVDLGFAPEELMIATLILGKFGANLKKTPPVRQAMIEHFLKQGTVETLNVPAKKVYSKELLAQFAIAQPTPPGTESLFADIPVFGVNRIAVRVPKLADEPHPKYLSFCLSEFRAFVAGMQNVCGIEGFGTNVPVPLTEQYTTSKCHLSQAPVLELNQLNYYEKDPGFKLEVSGWRCTACKIVISETARAEAKLGGANGKALPKTKCPKCSQKFGNLPLYQVAGANAPKPVQEAVETAAAAS